MYIYYWLQKANIHWFVSHQGSFKVYPLPDDPSVAAPPRQFRELPDSGPQECLVRVYVIQAIDLQPKDNNGRVRMNLLLHNFLQLTAAWRCSFFFFFFCSVWSIHKDLAWEEFSWRQRSLHTQHHQPCVWKVNIELCRGDYMEHYCVCASQTCLFVLFRMFEMTCFLPQEKDLKISVYDYDLLTRDDKVGETIIDLENRFLSRYNSYCGLPQTYCM